jgi:Tol biopolymer transport system component
MSMCPTTWAVDFEVVPGCCNPNVQSLHPALSPDATSLAFVESYWVPIDFQFHVVTFSDLGGSPAQINFDGLNSNLLYPRWSSDGQRMVAVFCAGPFDSPDNNGVWVFDSVPGVLPRRVAASTTCYERPDFSPDGSMVVFAGPSEQLFLGSLVLPLEPQLLPTSGSSPTWGEYGIAYVHDGNIWINENTGPRALTSGSGNDRWPSWSADGEWLVFVSDRSGNPDLWVVSRKGGTAVQLTFDPADDVQPDWSEDGKTIVFLSNRSGVTEIWKATNLPDWTVSVEETSWSTMKQHYR